MMRKPKRKYAIICRESSGWSDTEITTRHFIVGETWAVSEAQAVNNWCYRTRHHNPTVHEWADDGARIQCFDACLIDEIPDGITKGEVFDFT